MNATRWTAPGHGVTVGMLRTAIALSFQDGLSRKAIGAVDHLAGKPEGMVTNLFICHGLGTQLTEYDLVRIAACEFAW